MGLIDGLVAARSGMKNPTKNAEGQLGNRKYSYADLSQFIDQVEQECGKNGVYVYQKCLTRDGLWFLETWAIKEGESVDEDGNSYQENEELLLDVQPISYETDPREWGKRVTMARRYGICNAFGLVGVEDTDCDTGPAKGERQQRQSRPADPKKAAYQRIGALKKRALELGFTEESMRDYLDQTFTYEDGGPKQFTDLDLDELGSFEQFLQGVTSGGQQ